MQRITYTNASGTMTGIFDYAKNDEDYILISYDDSQSVNNWTTTGYNQHGASYIKSLMNERVVRLSYILRESTGKDFYRHRAEMMSLFNPMDESESGNKLGVLVVENDNCTRALDVYVSAMPAEEETWGTARQYTVELRAPFPFYRDVEENVVQFNDITGGLEFTIDFHNDIIFGEDGKTAMIYNYGDIEAPIRIEISGADMDNPMLISNKDGKYIGLTRAIAAKEKIIITTGYGDKNIMIDEKSAARYLTEGSVWLQLERGENRLTCQVSGGIPTMLLYWYNWYLGV